MKATCFLIFLILGLFFLANGLWAQDADSGKEPAVSKEDIKKQEEQAKEAAEVQNLVKTEKKLSPAFPVENNNIIFIEGEDAVSTNFNKQPILNFKCSASRTLQLSQTKGLQGGAAFYADFVFYVKEAGTYEFWFGGAPASMRGEVFPTYVSPFEWVIDENDTYSSGKIKISTVEQYSPAYYWNRANTLTLQPGMHKIRFIVKERRGYDARFFFYLDCFFFVKKNAAAYVQGTLIPDHFPKNLTALGIDDKLKSIDDYLILIRDNPSEVSYLIEASYTYSLVLDFLNAIKYLNRAKLIEPESSLVLYLLAKNNIWKGDVITGLQYYKDLLKRDPSNLAYWIEAGKIAAWSGRFTDSLKFFTDGLKVFPEDLDLLVNISLTHLWAGRTKQADENLTKVLALVGEDPLKLKKLARSFIINGYLGQAIKVYKTAIALTPQDVELYLLLEQAYLNSGEPQIASTIRENIRNVFTGSDELERYLNISYERIDMKNRILDEYRTKIAADPDNLGLRETLARALFWNGLKKEAVIEYLNILTNYAYQYLTGMVQKSAAYLEKVDKLYFAYYMLLAYRDQAREKAAAVNTQADLYIKALDAYSTALAKPRKEGESDPSAGLLAAAETAGDKLASLIADSQALTEKYNKLVEFYSQESTRIEVLTQDDTAEEELFQQIITPIGWKWNRAGFISELQGVASRGMVLARHVLGNIFQFEKNLSAASGQYQTVARTNIYPELEYAQAQTYLWQGDLEQASAAYSGKAADFMAYAASIAGLFRTYPRSLVPGVSSLPDDYAAAVKQTIDQLNRISREADPRIKEIKAGIDELQTVIGCRMIRTFFQYQEETLLLRNELGDSYLQQENFEKAIEQYLLVLSIQPDDLSANYRIGTVYHRNKDYYKAKEHYLKVYKIDPYYQNVMSLYNSLAGETAMQYRAESKYLIETGKLTFEAETEVTIPFNDFWGIDVLYTMTYIRQFAYPIEPHYSYPLHDLAIGLPINLLPSLLTVTPWFGAIFILSDDFYDKETSAGFSTTPNSEILELLGCHSPFIYGKVSVKYSPFSFLTIDADYLIGTQPESLGFLKTKMFYQWLNANIMFGLSMFDIPVIKDTVIRTYLEADLINDSALNDFNLIWLLTEELQITFLKIPVPDMALTLIGKFAYEDSTIEGNSGINYFSPQDNLTVGAGLKISSSFKISAEDAFIVALFGGGYYTSELNGWAPFDTKERFKYEVDLNMSYKMGDALIFLGFYLSASYNLDSQEVDVYSVQFKLGFTTKMADYLTP